MTSSSEWALRAAPAHRNGRDCAQVPAPPIHRGFHPTGRGEERTEAHSRGGAWQKPGVLGTSGQRLVAGPLHPWGRGPLLCRSGNEFRLKEEVAETQGR